MSTDYTSMTAPTDDQSSSDPNIEAIKVEIGEAIAQAKVRVAQLPRSRAGSLVATKLDEAELWLTRVPEPRGG